MADTGIRFDGETNPTDHFVDPMDDSLALVGWWPASILSGGPEDPEDVPEGWAPLVEKGTEQTHILDTIEDPVAESAAVRFREDRKEAELEEKLEKLSGSELSEGELAALAALDAALGEGADVEDALSIAIAAAENYLNPSSQNRDFQQRRAGTVDRADRRDDTIETATRAEIAEPENIFTSPPGSQNRILNLATEIPAAAFGADPVFGFGFDFNVSQKAGAEKDNFSARRETETVASIDTTVSPAEDFGGITDAIAGIAAHMGGKAIRIGAFQVGLGSPEGSANSTIVFRVNHLDIHRLENRVSLPPVDHAPSGGFPRLGSFNAPLIHLVNISPKGVHRLQPIYCFFLFLFSHTLFNLPSSGAPKAILTLPRKVKASLAGFNSRS